MFVKKILNAFFLIIATMPITLMAAPEKMTTVAITLIVNHPALTEAYAGVMEELKTQGLIEGKNLKIIYSEAYGNIRLAEQIAINLVKQAPDVIVPISTPSAQTVAKADQKAQIPIVFAAVTDPIAAQLVPSLKQPGGYVTGVYDFPPVAGQLEIIRDILPQIKTLGILHNPAEINSMRMVEEIKANAQSLKIIEAQVNSADDIPAATRSLIGKVDAIYVPADNTVTSQIHSVIDIATANRIPVFSSEHGSVAKGALASLAYDQYEVGRMAGAMVIEILAGKKPGTIDVVKPAKAQLTINTATAQALNIKIPDDVLKSAAKLITSNE